MRIAAGLRRERSSIHPNGAPMKSRSETPSLCPRAVNPPSSLAPPSPAAPRRASPPPRLAAPRLDQSALPPSISSNLLQPPPITTASPPISTPPPPISSNHLQASRLPFHLLRSPPISPHLLTQSAPLATSRHQGGYRGEYRGGVLPVRGTAGRRGDNQVTSEGLLAVLLQLVGVGAEEEALLR